MGCNIQNIVERITADCSLVVLQRLFLKGCKRIKLCIFLRLLLRILEIIDNRDVFMRYNSPFRINDIAVSRFTYNNVFNLFGYPMPINIGSQHTD